MRNPIKMYDEWLEDKLHWQSTFFESLQGFASVIVLLVGALTALIFAIAFICSVIDGPCVDWKAEQCVDSHGVTHTCKGSCIRHQND